jgi:hypothetical protein
MPAVRTRWQTVGQVLRESFHRHDFAFLQTLFRRPLSLGVINDKQVFYAFRTVWQFAQILMPLFELLVLRLQLSDDIGLLQLPGLHILAKLRCLAAQLQEIPIFPAQQGYFIRVWPQRQQSFILGTQLRALRNFPLQTRQRCTLAAHYPKQHAIPGQE